MGELGPQAFIRKRNIVKKWDNPLGDEGKTPFS